MKPTLTLTGFIVTEQTDRYSIELIGTINREEIKMISRPVSSIGLDNIAKKGILHRALSGLTLQAAITLHNREVKFDYPSGMTLSEQLSLFDVKQTPEFSNTLSNSGLETNVVLLAIW